MEVELKYNITDELIADRILNDPTLNKIKEIGSEKTINMYSVYYDTIDYDLSKAKIAFRMRKENDKVQATVKWDSKVDNGKHAREEINLILNEDTHMDNPNIEIFSQSPAEEKLVEASKGKRLIPIMKMNFVRKQFRIDDGETICEISLDKGDIIAGKGKAPISELEIELFLGKEENLVKLGEELAKKYNLEPENQSKFVKGMELV